MGICFNSEIRMKSPKPGLQITKSDISCSARLESIHDRYKFVKILGYGQFGVVREAYKIDSNSLSLS